MISHSLVLANDASLQSLCFDLIWLCCLFYGAPLFLATKVIPLRSQASTDFSLHSVHCALVRLCSQIAEPPHSLHSLRRRSCSQICDPPHTLHTVLIRLCWQSAPPSPPAPFRLALLAPCSYPLVLADRPPPHSLHLVRIRLCSQISGPPHSFTMHILHTVLIRLCSQSAHPALFHLALFAPGSSPLVPAD